MTSSACRSFDWLLGEIRKFSQEKEIYIQTNTNLLLDMQLVVRICLQVKQGICRCDVPGAIASEKKVRERESKRGKELKGKKKR